MRHFEKEIAVTFAARRLLFGIRDQKKKNPPFVNTPEIGRQITSRIRDNGKLREVLWGDRIGLSTTQEQEGLDCSKAILSPGMVLLISHQFKTHELLSRNIIPTFSVINTVASLPTDLWVSP